MAPPTEGTVQERSWLGHSGEMAERIRAHDWSKTPLGPMEAWPQSLRTAVDIMLGDGFPATIQWGRQAILIYNDAYIPVIGDRHPSALGRSSFESFSEIGPHLETVLTRVFAGETVVLQDQHFSILHNGRPKDVWFTLSHIPLRDEAGEVAAALVQGVETSARILAERMRDGAEASLRESEERYRLLFEAMDEGYLLADVIFDDDERPIDMEYVEANPAATGMVGTDLTGRRLTEVSPRYEPYWFEIWGSVARTGQGQRLERYASPEDRWYDFYVFKPEPDNQDSRRVAVLFRDVTDRKRGEEALRKSEERLRNAFAIETVGVMFWGSGFEMTEVNDAFLRMTGFAREEVLGKSWPELTPEEFYPASLRAVEELDAFGETTPYEKQYFRKNGSRWWGLFAARKVGDEVVEFVLDVTGRKVAEEALRALIEGIPQLVWRAERDGAWTWASPQWTAYTGQSSDDSRGAGWLDMVHPDDRATAIKNWRGAGEEAEFHADYRVFHAGEERYRWFQTRATPVRDEAGGIMEWLGTSTDVDDLRQLQEEQKVLVSELQHRTRNLLAIVSSISSQTVARSETLKGFKAQFEDRLAALSRVQGLLSRAEHEPITIGELIQVELDALGASDFGDRIAVGGPEVSLDSSMVQTLALALHELATNARKYGALKSGGGRLTVGWAIRPTKKGRHLALEWREEGINPEREKKSSATRGYGRTLIERALPYSLGAKTSYALGETELRCTIDLPLEGRDVTEEEDE